MIAWSRALCYGPDIQYIVFSNGSVIGPLDRKRMVSDDPATKDLDIVGKMLDSMVRGACLALSDPEQYKRKKIGSSTLAKNKRESGAPDLANARYMLSAPVQVDLRDVLKAVQRGETRKSGKLTFQFLVRGHWKNQAHGPKMSLRKRIWLQPFWKGPEESRVLLRSYVVKDENNDGNEPDSEPKQ